MNRMHNHDDHEAFYEIVKFIASGSGDRPYMTGIKIFCLVWGENDHIVMI